MSNPRTESPARCPICRKPPVPKHAPFCSASCQDRDLLAWLDERYVVPGRQDTSSGTDFGEDG